MTDKKKPTPMKPDPIHPVAYSSNVVKPIERLARRLVKTRRKLSGASYRPSGAQSVGAYIPDHLYKQLESETPVKSNLSTLRAQNSSTFVPLSALNAPTFLTAQYPHLTFCVLNSTHRLALAHHWTHLSDEDKHLRFFHQPKNEFLQHRAQTMNLDQPRIFGAFDQQGNLIATAEWALENPQKPQDQWVAECAFSTLPSARAQGIAKRLALWCALDCYHNHIEQFVIYFLRHNQGAKALAQSLGAKFKPAPDFDAQTSCGHFHLTSLMKSHPYLAKPYQPYAHG